MHGRTQLADPWNNLENEPLITVRALFQQKIGAFPTLIEEV